MKITKVLYIVSAISIIALLSPTLSSTSKLKVGTNMHFGILKARSRMAPNNEKENPAFKNLTKDDLPDVPIYFEGWLRYFWYAKSGDQKPKAFFKNPNFLTQVKSNTTKPDDQVFYYNLVWAVFNPR